MQSHTTAAFKKLQLPLQQSSNSNTIASAKQQQLRIEQQ